MQFSPPGVRRGIVPTSPCAQPRFAQLRDSLLRLSSSPAARVTMVSSGEALRADAARHPYHRTIPASL